MLKIFRNALIFSTLFLFWTIEIVAQQDIPWRDNASNGDWVTGTECSEIGNVPSQWFYSFFGPNPARNSPYCSGVYNLVFGNNHILTTNNNYTTTENIYGIRLDGGADLSRTFTGQPIRLQSVSSNNPKIENFSIANHIFNTELELFATTELNPINGDLTFNDNINTNDNFIDVFGNNGNSLFVNGIIDGSSGIAVKQNSILVLNGLNSYSGGTLIEAGKIVVNSNNGLGSLSGSTTVSIGAVLELDGSDMLSEPLFLNGTGQSDDGALRKVNSGTDQYSGSITLQSDARIHIDEANFDYLGALNSAGFTLYLGGDGNFNFESGSSLLNATKTSGDGSVFKDGSGRLEFRPTTSMTGNFYFLNGEVRQFTGDWSTSGLLILGDGLLFRSDGATDREIAKPTRIDGNITLGFGTGLNSEMNFLTSVDFNSGNRTLTMTNENFISGIATNGSFTKAGTGTLTLQGSTANTLTGTSFVNEGLLVLSKAADTQATDALTINTSGTVRTDANNQWGTTTPPFVQIFGGTLNINNTDQRLALAGDASASVLLGSGTITIDGTGTDTFAGVISGSGGLTKEGSGTEILTGSNTYTGVTIVTQGVLRLGSSDVLADASPIVLNGGTLQSSGTNTETVSTLELAESSTIDLTGTGELLTFANSAGVSWNQDATLTILGWSGVEGQSGINSQLFLSGVSDLTEDQLLRFQFSGYDFGAEILPTGEIVPKDQNIQRFEDFNRMANDALGNTSSGLGGTWIETETMDGCPAIGDYIRIDSQGQLLLRNTGSSCVGGDEGEKFATINVSGLYATRFEVADSLMEWNFNMQQNQADPSGDNRTAFIIGSTLSDISLGSGAEGYAVALGESGGSDDIHLIYFNDGLPNINSFGAFSIISQSISTGENPLSVRVTFDPCSDIWSLTVREDLIQFRDPASISSVGGTASNTVHVDKDLIYIGGYRKHSSGAGQETIFDNIYIPSSLPSTNSYTWNGSVDDDYQNPDNWTPQRACTKPNDLLDFSLSANEIVDNIPNETIGGLNITGNFELNFKDIADGTSSVITIRDGSFSLNSQSTVIFDTDNSSGLGDGLEINMIGIGTGTVDGTIILRNSLNGVSRAHRILADDAGDIQVNGLIRVEDLNGNLFGDDVGTQNIAEFNSGSVYECLDGANPFALSQPASKVIFEEGSLYRYLNDDAFLSLGGRTYADFEYSAIGVTTVGFASSADWNVDNLRILSGLLNISPPTDDGFDINCSGDFEIQGTLNIDPADTITLTLNGSGSQRIFGSGALDLTPNVVFRIDNSSMTETVELEKDLTVFNDFELLNGELQGNGATLTMAGQNHLLRVEGDLVGEVSGANDEINLVIADSTTLVGNSGVCDFLNITVNTNIPFSLERGIRCVNGTFSVQNDAQLILSAGGFIGAGTNYRSPTYQPGSFLIYESGGFYSRSVEWNSLTGAGYPENVILTNSTTLLPAANSNSSAAFGLEGGLLIEPNSHLDMSNSGSDNMNVPLQIGGDLNLQGSLTASGAIGGDIIIDGDWTQLSSGAFDANDRQVAFSGTTLQSVTSPSGINFDYIQINNPQGVELVDDITVDEVFDFTDGIVVPDHDYLDGTEKIIFTAGSSVGAVSNASHYQGIVVKEGNTEFVFPVGDTSSVNPGVNFYQPVRIFDLGGATSIEAQYFSEPHPEAGPWYDGSAGANGELEEIGNCDYWIVNKTNLGDPDVRLAFTFTNPFNSDADPTNDLCNDINDINTVFITSFNSLEWDLVSTNFDFVGNDELATQTRVDTTLGGINGNYGPFTFRSSNGADNILPITLLSFQAEAVDGRVRASWVTVSETNNDYFTVERSKDGNFWEEAGRVEGAGNSNSERSYSFMDERPYAGISYYRLRQTDFDGATSHSQVRAVEILQGDDFGLDKVYRGQDGLNLIYRSTAPYVVVEIYDLLGKRLHGELLENYGNGFGTIYPDLARGAYILRLSHGGEMDAEKFVY